MVEFSNREEVQHWLADKPREVAIVIAARAAMRVVPALVRVLDLRRKTQGDEQANLLTVLRATAAPWVAARYPNRRTEIRAPTIAAAVSATGAAGRAARAASDASSTKGTAFSLAADAASAASAIAARAARPGRAAARADAYHAVALDAQAIDDGVLVADLAMSSLWLDGEPAWVRQNLARLTSALLTLNEDWEVWIAWYEARLEGRVANEELEVARVMIREEIWREGPKVVNAEVRQLIALHGHTVEQAIEALGRYDFFLSYSSEDESIARWIAALVRAAGFSVFAQFSDIPVGSNFVREMQRGLDRSIRLIALQSPTYLKSDHCQAEWSEAYSRDPSGRARRLLQFLVAPTDLPPLARQIVYTSLVGLSPSDAAAAVLRSIGHEGPLPEIPPGWPGSAAIESIQAASGGIYNVAPGANGLLQRQPTIISETAEGAFTPEQLFNDLAREIIELHDYAQKKRGNFSYSDELKTRTTKLRDTTAVGFSNCDPLALNKQLVWILRAIKYDQRYGLIPDGDAIEFYAADLFGYYNRLEHIFPKLGAYRKMEARQRFTSPTPEVEQAIEIVYGSLSNPNVAQGALSPDLSAELKQAGEGIAEAKKFAEGKPTDETLDVTIESHADAATRSLAVWNWLANAREKFVKSGHKAEDVEKAIANYEKLYKTVSPEMQRYLGYLLKWFF